MNAARRSVPVDTTGPRPIAPREPSEAMICVISAALFCVLDGDFTRLGHLGRRQGTLALASHSCASA
jgi:hypothetical protein